MCIQPFKSDRCVIAKVDCPCALYIFQAVLLNLICIFPPLQSTLTLSPDGILGPLSSDLPAMGLNLNDIPLAED